ncbi:hypothetical protein CHS0354_036342 [Potamilus streckersoni]|uniref:Uncharacterized protein n=1 Tax=Potamilus streckersoni TaxID=2493646 RepID=A0AAE0VVG1_9BIVA|nr:hypothetical protein CHS0354_036342 [Potamilus streckersoni]
MDHFSSNGCKNQGPTQTKVRLRLAFRPIQPRSDSDWHLDQFSPGPTRLAFGSEHRLGHRV